MGHRMNSAENGELKTILAVPADEYFSRWGPTLSLPDTLGGVRNMALRAIHNGLSFGSSKITPVRR